MSVRKNDCIYFSSEHDQGSIESTNGTSSTATPVYKIVTDNSNQQTEGEFEEGNANCSITTGMEADDEEFPELPNVDGLIQSRELLIEVLLPCAKLLELFVFRVKNKLITRATTGCLMAFRIAGEERNSEVVVDEIASIESGAPKIVRFKLGHVVNANKLVAVDNREITDHVFDLWLQRLTIRNEPLPDVQTKYQLKMQAIDWLTMKVADLTKQLVSSGSVNDKQVQALNMMSRKERNRLADKQEARDAEQRKILRALKHAKLMAERQKLTRAKKERNALARKNHAIAKKTINFVVEMVAAALEEDVPMDEPIVQQQQPAHLG